MNGLMNLQCKFQKYLMDSDSSIQNDVIDTKKVRAEIRLGIYGNAYRSRLTEALASNFPILKMYLGDKKFQELAELYIKIYPSQFRSIRWLGDKLELFLKENICYCSFPYLSELAKFEWALSLIFDAADSGLFSIENIKNIPSENWSAMRLISHPSTSLLNFRWNVVQIWQDLSKGKDPSDPIENHVSTHYVFWRKDFVNQFCPLPDDEAYAIDSMLKRLSFGEICEGLCQWVEEHEAGLRAASLLKGWISSGLISEIEVFQQESSDE